MRILAFIKALNWRLGTGALLAASILHILATLAAPATTGISVYRRLAAALPANSMRTLPPITREKQPLPFMSPDVRYAMCRFDSSAGAVTISADLPDIGWTLSIYAKNGDSLYATAAVPERSTHVELTIVRSLDHFTGLTPEARGIAQQGAPTITLTARDGLAVLRAPDKGFAYSAETEAILARAICGTKAETASKSPSIR